MKYYFDREKGLICRGDPDKMTAQQRANWTLIQTVLDQEYNNGFRRGHEVALMEMKDKCPNPVRKVDCAGCKYELTSGVKYGKIGASGIQPREEGPDSGAERSRTIRERNKTAILLPEEPQKGSQV